MRKDGNKQDDSDIDFLYSVSISSISAACDSCPRTEKPRPIAEHPQRHSKREEKEKKKDVIKRSLATNIWILS